MTPKAVVNALELRLSVLGPPVQLRDAIETELLVGGMTAAAAAENLDRLRAGVAREIKERRAASDHLGEIAVLHLRGHADEIVHGSSYVFADDEEEIRQAKLNRVSVADIWAHIRSLNFSLFERFGKSVLRELGCTTSRVTSHAGDQGIDFYGELSVGSLVGVNPALSKLMHETKVKVVGQAKHYPNASIGPAVVRELVGALSLSRTQTFSKMNLDLLSEIQLRPFSPLVAMLFTTGGFTKGARYLADQAGLVVFSGWQLAVFLADRSIGLVLVNGEVVFDAATFDAWLHTD